MSQMQSANGVTEAEPEVEQNEDLASPVSFLVFYQFLPETTKIYRIVTNDGDVVRKLRASHGQYVGMKGCPVDIERFLCAIDDVDGIEELYDDSDKDAGKTRIMLETRIDEIIVCGAIL